MRKSLILGLVSSLSVLVVLNPAFGLTQQTVKLETTYPFRGVKHIHRIDLYRGGVPDPIRANMHIVEVNLSDPDIRIQVTEPNGASRGETTLETTRAHVSRIGAQIGINANYYNTITQNFFGYKIPLFADNLSLAASNGTVYSQFLTKRPAFKQPALNLSQNNVATVVEWDNNNQPSRQNTATRPQVPLYNAVAGLTRALKNGVNVGQNDLVYPRTAVGVTLDNKLLLFTVDGRQRPVSDGLSTRMIGSILREYGATEAIVLDGGGSTTLVFADPVPRLINVPVGLGPTRTERPVSNNLAIFAAPRTRMKR